MNKIDAGNVKKILLIRRDNIGDLICTTPAIHALRERFPDAKIGILVNSYNADAVANNSDVDEIYVYEKAKHVEDRGRRLVWLSNFRLLLKVRREKYDVAIACGSYSPNLARYASLVGAKHRIGYARSGAKSVSYDIPLDEPSEQLHEVVVAFKLLEPLGISGEPPKLVLTPSADEEKKVLHFLFPTPNSQPQTPTFIAMHISSRKENNRWPAERFIELGNRLISKYNVKPLLLWAPGSGGNKRHPGDDEKAEQIAQGMIAQPLVYKTTRLKELIAALNVCKMVICMDGGAMHIAAALGKPILAIWGSTDKRRWSPWKVEHSIAQRGKRADEVSAQEAAAAFEKLWSSVR